MANGLIAFEYNDARATLHPQITQVKLWIQK